MSNSEYIYIFKSIDEEILYVGIATDAFKRIREHKTDKMWFREVVEVEIARVIGERSACEMIEWSLIDQLKPKYNIVTWEYKKTQVLIETITFSRFEINDISREKLNDLATTIAENLIEETEWQRFRRLVPLSDYKIKKYIVILQNRGYIFDVKPGNFYSFRKVDGYALELTDRLYNKFKNEKNYNSNSELYDMIFEKVKLNFIRNKFSTETAFCTPGYGRLYRTREIYNLLGISSKSLGKYCNALEDAGYEFVRNDNGKRELFKPDYLIIKKLYIAKKTNQSKIKELASKILNESAI